MRAEVETLLNNVPTFGDIFLGIVDVLHAIFTILVIKNLRDTEKELRKEGGF